MKIFVGALALAALALPVTAQAADTNKTNASAACKAERTAMTVAIFKATYGTNKTRSNAFGKCVSKRTKTEIAGHKNASKACDAEEADPNFAATHGGKTFAQFYGTGKKGANAHGKCVSSKAKALRTATTKANVNAAKTCKAERAQDPAAFKAKWGTNKNKSNAFGKCVSATAKKPYALPA